MEASEVNSQSTLRFSHLPRPGAGRQSEARTAAFSAEVAHVVAWMEEYVRELGFAPVARSWLYAFESARIITKGDFDWAGKWLADRRKQGQIPFHLVGHDITRAMTGRDVFDQEATPREYINRQLHESLQQAEMYWPSSYWKYQHYYPIIWCEKGDLLKLFEPEIPDAAKRFAGKGWADINSRVAVIHECMWAEENDLLPVILYCGDHDPAGLQISECIGSNLREIAQVLHWEDGLEAMEDDDRIIRFGLTADFIDHAGLLWIDGLETSSGGDLADQSHKHHWKDYVQSYLLQFGPRKCEANALIANRTAALALMRQTIWDWLDASGQEQWQEENRVASGEASQYADGIRRMLAMFDAAGVLYNPRQLPGVIRHGLASLPASTDNTDVVP